MASAQTSTHSSWWLFAIPAIIETQNLFSSYVLLTILVASLSAATLAWAFTPGGLAWKDKRSRLGPVSIPGPRGLPIFGSLFKLSHGLAHRTLACMASTRAGVGATQLMAFSLGRTAAVVTADPQIAREILTSPHFANRPVKASAKQLMFSRAIGFAPDGTYWQLLRRISSTHLFSPKRIAAHESGRQLDCTVMVNSIAKEQAAKNFVVLREHLQSAALNNIMGTVFGKRYDMTKFNNEVVDLQEMVREGFAILGAFNWSDYLPWLSSFYDPCHIKKRCSILVPRVKNFVRKIIHEHRLNQSEKPSDSSDFVDVLLSLNGSEKLNEDDMVACYGYEMIFRGTDTTTLLTEWVMAELVLNPNIQTKLRQELDAVVGNKGVTDADVAKLFYLQAVIKETLRVHPPGPLLSWARLSTSDVRLSNGMVVPAHTTTIVNMWAITHDSNVWEDALVFKPERFLKSLSGSDIDVRGGDTRLAPFGAGRRVCPGKNLGLVTVSLWVAKLVQDFEWVGDPTNPIDLTELLKLSCEMKNPLCAKAMPKRSIALV